MKRFDVNERKRGWTRWLRWSHVAVSAKILGVIDNDQKGAAFDVNAILKRRRREGLVEYHKTGRAQGAAAYYRARKKG